MWKMATDKINITILDEESKYRKFFKIIPYRSGGFAIVLPKFVDSQTGRLEKTLVTYENMGTHIETKRDESEQYGANDIVKFSYHTDGFVQFSSTTNDKIVSGRNPDGTPKGLGVFSWPLNNPISTGPSMSMTIWGLDRLSEETENKVDKRYLFEVGKASPHPKATYKRDDELAFAMAMYIIPNSIRGDIHEVDGKKISHLAMIQQLPDGSSFMRLREQVTIVEIPDQDYRIGISWFFIPKKSESEFGYMFFGPTDGKRGLAASYPAIDYGQKLLMKDLTFIANGEK
jgi:hypothetical protein